VPSENGSVVTEPIEIEGLLSVALPGLLVDCTNLPTDEFSEQ